MYALIPLKKLFHGLKGQAFTVREIYLSTTFLASIKPYQIFDNVYPYTS